MVWGSSAVVAFVVAGFLGSGCARYSEHASAGEVALDSATSPRAALLKLHNGSMADIRVYTIRAGREQYLGRVGGARLGTFRLDADHVDEPGFAILIRRSTDSTTKTFDQLRVREGETVNVVVRTKLDRSAVLIRKG